MLYIIIQHYIVLYHTVLYYILLYYVIVLNCIVWYYIILYYIILYYIIFHCNILYYIKLYCIILYCIILYVLGGWAAQLLTKFSPYLLKLVEMPLRVPSVSQDQCHRWVKLSDLSTQSLNILTKRIVSSFIQHVSWWTSPILYHV